MGESGSRAAPRPRFLPDDCGWNSLLCWLPMEDATIPEPEPVAPRRLGPLLFAALVVLAGAAAAVLTWPTSSRRAVRQFDVGSPYQNTRLGVNYVGDSGCIRCHADIAETYSRHPMGRSLAPIGRAHPPGGDGEGGPPRFEVKGLLYSVESQGDRVIHQETRRNAAGETLYKIEAEVKYAIGSGRQAFSYLIERDGFLFESPITWYTHDRGGVCHPAMKRASLASIGRSSRNVSSATPTGPNAFRVREQSLSDADLLSRSCDRL